MSKKAQKIESHKESNQPQHYSKKLNTPEKFDRAVEGLMQIFRDKLEGAMHPSKTDDFLKKGTTQMLISPVDRTDNANTSQQELVLPNEDMILWGSSENAAAQDKEEDMKKYLNGVRGRLAFLLADYRSAATSDYQWIFSVSDRPTINENEVGNKYEFTYTMSDALNLADRRAMKKAQPAA